MLASFSSRHFAYRGLVERMLAQISVLPSWQAYSNAS